MAKPKPDRAKRANRHNPREDRNFSRPVNEDYSSTPTKKTRIDLFPRNIAQEEYLDLIQDTTKDIVVGMGPAGAGKTYISTTYALQQFLSNNPNVKKIVVARPLVGSGNGVGYLPGGLIEKLSPWCRPVLDVLKEHLSVPQVERMLELEQIELLGLFAVRGMTLKNCILILDEAQNATVEEMKMIMTRMGENSRIFITGDIRQSDLRDTENGLRYIANRLTDPAYKSDRIAVSGFSKKDIVRHPVIEDVLKLFDE